MQKWLYVEVPSLLQPLGKTEEIESASCWIYILATILW